MEHDNHPNALLYMPWRVAYTYGDANTLATQQSTHIPTIQQEQKPCVFCRITQDPTNDEKSYILHRGKYTCISLASQPYVSSGAHFLILPYAHERELYNLSREAFDELNSFSKQLSSHFSDQCNEIYSGFNIGKSAGASIPDHLHQHIVVDTMPRCNNLIELKQITYPTINLLSQFRALKLELQMLGISSACNNKEIDHSSVQRCYYCSLAQLNNTDEENLIIYRGKHSILLFDHHPKCVGHITIVPIEHIEHMNLMPHETHQELHSLGLKIYPIILAAVHATDLNFGITVYGATTQHKQHLRLEIIPRKEELIGGMTLLGGKRAIIANIDELYAHIKKEFNKDK